MYNFDTAIWGMIFTLSTLVFLHGSFTFIDGWFALKRKISDSHYRSNENQTYMNANRYRIEGLENKVRVLEDDSSRNKKHTRS